MYLQNRTGTTIHIFYIPSLPVTFCLSALTSISLPLHLCICRLSAFWSSSRPISDSQLHALLHFHLCPIYLVVFKGSYAFAGISHLEGGFTLRCLQRLSRPDLATRPCHWRDNRCTRGQSIPVLSY